MEHCTEDLDSIVRTRKLAKSPERIWAVVKGSLCGLEFLHRNKLIHRDVKPVLPLRCRSLLQGNVLLTDYWLPKISDLGSVVDMWSEEMPQVEVPDIATYHYMTPEVAESTITEKVDIFRLVAAFQFTLTSLGITAEI